MGQIWDNSRHRSPAVRRINRRAAVILPLSAIAVATVVGLAATAPAELVGLAYLATYAGIMMFAGWAAHRICSSR